MGVLRRGETAQTPTARWKVAVPEIEEIIRRRERTREICTTLFDSGFASAAVKLLFRAGMAEDARGLLKKLTEPKNFDQEYAKIIILRKTGETVQAKNLINAKRDRKTIEEVGLLGVEIAKIDPKEGKKIAELHHKIYPKNIEILIVVAQILQVNGDEELKEVVRKIKQKISKAQYPRKITYRAKLVLDEKGERLGGIIGEIERGNKEQIRRQATQAKSETAGEICKDLEDCLNGHYFEIENPEIAKEVFEAWKKLRERAAKAEAEQVERVAQILEAHGPNSLERAIEEFGKVDWRFSEKRGELTQRLAERAIEPKRDTKAVCAVLKIIIRTNNKKLFLEVMEAAHESMDEKTVVEKYEEAIEAKLLNFKDASKEAKKIEETDILLATRIRSHFEELANEMLDSLISRAHEIDTQTLKECISRVFEVEEIRKGRNSKKVEQLMEIYEKRRDPSQMN